MIEEDLAKEARRKKSVLDAPFERAEIVQDERLRASQASARQPEAAKATRRQFAHAGRRVNRQPAPIGAEAASQIARSLFEEKDAEAARVENEGKRPMDSRDLAFHQEPSACLVKGHAGPSHSFRELAVAVELETRLQVGKKETASAEDVVSEDTLDTGVERLDVSERGHDDVGIHDRRRPDGTWKS